MTAVLTHVPLLDVDVTPLSADEVADRVVTALADRSPLQIGNLNLHGVYLFHTDAVFAEYCRDSDLVLIDGAPVAWAARAPHTRRVGSTDWLDRLLPRLDGTRVLAVGGTAAASAGAAAHMREHFPRIEWIGVDGFSSHEPDAALRDRLARADIVLVGMGMPLQEHWIESNRALMPHAVVANVGGCFDYYAGTQRLAPRWMGALGLEWAYRLARSPRRLAGRYLVEPFALAGVLIRNHRRRVAQRRSDRAS